MVSLWQVLTRTKSYLAGVKYQVKDVTKKRRIPRGQRHRAIPVSGKSVRRQYVLVQWSTSDHYTLEL
ncbi:putative prospero homeobox protein 2 [Sesbania bispinosa]|nr:putative prospero homeobox protein 2 [Sesbania bispinosa]